MKRGAHILFNLPAAFLVVALIGLWIRSFHIVDAISRQRWHDDAGTYRGTFRHLYSGRGVIGIEQTDLTTSFPSTISTDAHWEWNTFATELFLRPQERSWERLGFGYVSTSQATRGLRSSRVTTRAYWIPYWLPVIVAAIVPLRWLTKWLVRAKRRRRGRCVECGYDLRFTPDRCPECGSPVPSAHQPPGLSPPAEAPR